MSGKELMVDGKPLSTLRVVDLKDELEKRGLSKSGSKKDLAERLKVHLQIEKHREGASRDEEQLPNISMQEKLAEQNPFIRDYFASQAELYHSQKVVKKLYEEETRKESEASSASADEGCDSPVKGKKVVSSSERSKVRKLVQHFEIQSKEKLEEVQKSSNKNSKPEDSEDVLQTSSGADRSERRLTRIRSIEIPKSSNIKEIERASPEKPLVLDNNLTPRSDTPEDLEKQHSPLKDMRLRSKEKSTDDLPGESEAIKPVLAKKASEIGKISESRVIEAPLNSVVEDIPKDSAKFSPIKKRRRSSEKSPAGIKSTDTEQKCSHKLLKPTTAPSMGKESIQDSKTSTTDELPVLEKPVTNYEDDKIEKQVKPSDKISYESSKVESLSTGKAEQEEEKGAEECVPVPREEESTSLSSKSANNKDSKIVIETIALPEKCTTTDTEKQPLQETSNESEVKDKDHELTSKRKSSGKTEELIDTKSPIESKESPPDEQCMVQQNSSADTVIATVIVPKTESDVVCIETPGTSEVNKLPILDADTNVKSGKAPSEEQQDFPQKPSNNENDTVKKDNSHNLSEESLPIVGDKKLLSEKFSPIKTKSVVQDIHDKHSSESSIAHTKRSVESDVPVNVDGKKDETPVDLNDGKGKRVDVKKSPIRHKLAGEEETTLPKRKRSSTIPESVKSTVQEDGDEKDENDKAELELHVNTTEMDIDDDEPSIPATGFKISTNQSVKSADKPSNKLIERNRRFQLSREKFLPKKRKERSDSSSSTDSRSPKAANRQVSVRTEEMDEEALDYGDEEKSKSEPEKFNWSGRILRLKSKQIIRSSKERKWRKDPTKKLNVLMDNENYQKLYTDVKPVGMNELKLEEKSPVRVERKIEIIRTVSMDVEDNDLPLTPSVTENKPTIRKVSIVPLVDENEKELTPPRNPSTHLIIVTNLVRPFTLPQLKEMLQRTGTIVDIWVDKIKSKCIAKFETEAQAVETRSVLHGIKWPATNSKPLQVDFSTEESFEEHKAKEIGEAKPVVEKPKVAQNLPVREWDMGKRSRSRSPSRVRRRSRSTSRDRKRGSGRRSHSPHRRRHSRTPNQDRKGRGADVKDTEPIGKALDELFRKTVATPSIYWLPLTPQQIAEKEDLRRRRMQERERRLAELSKLRPR